MFTLLRELEYDERAVLTVVVLMAMGNRAALTREALYEASIRVTQALLELPETEHRIEMLLCDARKLPLPSCSVDTVVTSPPYINVFNYHQNYRPAAERIGWRPLRSAPSEIGANRKHRMNRFLTVVQYAMDMLAALNEMRRVLRNNGSALVVIGRESSVRGMSFENGQLLAMLAVGGAGFSLRRWQERSFVSRFGGRIFEEILTLEPEKNGTKALPDFGRAVGLHMLKTARQPEESDVRDDLANAIEAAVSVEPSPVLAARDGFVACDGADEEPAPSSQKRARQACRA